MPQGCRRLSSVDAFGGAQVELTFPAGAVAVGQQYNLVAFATSSAGSSSASARYSYTIPCNTPTPVVLSASVTFNATVNPSYAVAGYSTVTNVVVTFDVPGGNWSYIRASFCALSALQMSWRVRVRY